MDTLRSNLLFIFGSATTMWNLLIDSEIGAAIGNISGVIIILLLIRKLVFALWEDWKTLSKGTSSGREDAGDPWMEDDEPKNVLHHE